PSTIKLFKNYMTEEDFYEGAILAESHLRNWNCCHGANYLHELIEEKTATNEAQATNKIKNIIKSQLGQKVYEHLIVRGRIHLIDHQNNRLLRFPAKIDKRKKQH
ncbi:MAG: hypothetical protein LUE87_03440, partial [Lachnospiraceae bacterium]|nr:hypothetical protein [Lachnospiraceae bacterium]